MNTSAPTIDDDAATARGVRLTPGELKALKPHVITLDDGRLSPRAIPNPRTAKQFATAQADIDAIFETHLPNFIAEKGLGTVPIVLYAHGGLVDVEAGFATAHQQVQWWKDNGVYPIHFIWKTGALTAIWDAIGRFVTGGSRGGIEEWLDERIEKGARALGGEQVWLDMKLDAAASSDGSGGARTFVKRLRQWMEDNPDGASLHAVGHSAGSIFHSHLLPIAFEAGVARIETVTFLAPAVRMDTFRTLLLPHADRIGNLAIFTMTEKAELDDRCLKVYGKSLLYLVSASFEANPQTPILGLRKDIKTDAAVSRLLDGPNGELVLTPNKNSGRTASGAKSHGDFNEDRQTMESVLLRVTDLAEPLKPFPTASRTPDPLEKVVIPDSPRGVGGKTALCVGIDEYTQPSDRLKGAVKDAELWRSGLQSAGFAVTLLTNTDATRQGILGALFQMVTTASRGDILVFQYAGHGTHAPDEPGGDEDKDHEDEAICPVDFREGQLILDDDFARIWDLLPDGVSLTIFFDSCHSGDGARNVTPGKETLPRGVELDEEDKLAFLAARGIDAPDDKRAALKAVKDSEPDTVTNPAGDAPQPREVLFAACESTQQAWETNGQGDFTGSVAPVLAQHIGRLSNRAFFDLITQNFDAHRQTPSFTATDALADALLLEKAEEATPGATASSSGGAGKKPTEADAAPDRSPETNGHKRNAAIAQILRGVADLVES
jgi:hypothetical protein